MVASESGKLVSERIQPDSMKRCWRHTRTHTHAHTNDAFNHKSNRNNKSPLNNFMAIFLRLPFFYVALIRRFVLNIFHSTIIFYTHTQRITNWLALYSANEVFYVDLFRVFLYLFLVFFIRVYLLQITTFASRFRWISKLANNPKEKSSTVPLSVNFSFWQIDRKSGVIFFSFASILTPLALQWTISITN